MTNLSAIHSKPENKRIEPANIGGVQNERWPNWPAMMDSPQGGHRGRVTPLAWYTKARGARHEKRFKGHERSAECEVQNARWDLQPRNLAIEWWGQTPVLLDEKELKEACTGKVLATYQQLNEWVGDHFLPFYFGQTAVVIHFFQSVVGVLGLFECGLR